MAADYAWWPFFHLKQYPKLGHVVTHNKGNIVIDDILLIKTKVINLRY